MKKIRTAVIGVGNMGRHHARVYSEISNLVAIADTAPERGKEIAKKHGVNFYRDYREMLDKERLDAVSVVVPTELHKKPTIECLRRGVPTLVEKPIANSLADARIILKQAEKSDTYLMVGHIERFNPAIAKLKQLIGRGKLGQIINLLAVRVGISPPKGKRLDVALDLAIHDVDIFNYLLGELPKRNNVIRRKVFEDNVADSALVILEYEKATGIVQTNWITPIRIRKLHVTGVDGFAELDYISQKLILYSEALKKEPCGNGDSFKSFVSSKPPKKEVYVSKKEPLKRELEYFLENIESGYLSKVPEEALMAIKILV